MMSDPQECKQLLRWITLGTFPSAALASTLLSGGGGVAAPSDQAPWVAKCHCPAPNPLLAGALLCDAEGNRRRGLERDEGGRWAELLGRHGEGCRRGLAAAAVEAGEAADRRAVEAEALEWRLGWAGWGCRVALQDSAASTLSPAILHAALAERPGALA